MLVRQLICFAAVAVAAGCSKEPIELGAADYDGAPSSTCALNTRSAAGGVHDDEETTAGAIRYSVRTPSNYDPSIQHPLLLVYAAAGQSRAASERFTGLTRAATGAGFIVAYTDHRRLSVRVLDELAKIPGEVAQKWCIDTGRIYLTGHSDGGTAAAAMAFRPDDGLEPAGIAASAAGVRGVDLEGYECPQGMRIMILHNRDDELFAGFGEEAAQWWASCKGCDGATAGMRDDGCKDFGDCAGGGAVRYCEGDGGHRRWPAMNETMLEFFE